MSQRIRVLVLALAAALLANPAPSPAQERTALGTNLAALTDWSTELPLVDAFKTSRAWVSGSAGVWDDQRPLDLDAHGWVRSLAPGQVARTLLFWGSPPHYPAGRYEIRYDGEGTLVWTPNVRLVTAAPGHLVVQVDSSRQGIGLTLTSVNPINYLRNLRVLMPVNAAPGEVFNPVFLDRIRNYRVLRFMNWMLGGNNLILQQHWQDRPAPEDARWSVRGAPVELMVALANRTGADPWFSIPHLADDDYVRRFAQAVAAGLDPGRKVYVEHSNEVFNPIFPQALYARQRGLALGLSTDPLEAQIRYHALRSRQIFGIFEEVLGAGRLVRVISSWSINPRVSELALSFGDTRAHTDALAIGPYFIIPYADQARVAGMTLDGLFAELRGSVLPRTRADMDRQAEVARRYGLPLIAYEGGQDLRELNEFQSNTALNALFDAANRDARMGALYARYLQDWSDAGGRLLVHFMNCYPYRVPGRVGSLEYIDQPRAEAPKYDALQRWSEGGAAAPAAVVAAAAAAPADDLAGLSDEFGDAATLASWRRVYREEGWPADQLERLDVNGMSPGWLTMMPYASTWYRDYRGELTYKQVEGDFVATTRVRVARRGGAAGAPQSQFSLAGVMVRTPRSITPATWRPGGENYVFLSLGAASLPGTFQYEVKSTTASDSRLAIVDAGTSEALLQVARVGPHLILLRRSAGGSWVVHRRYARADFPAALQVGLTAYTDYPTCAQLAPFDHNSRVITWGHPDLVARFDYVHYRRPVVPADLAGKDLSDPVAVPDADLLRFLGGAAATN